MLTPLAGRVIKYTFIVLIISGTVWFFTKIYQPSSFPVRTVQVMGFYQHIEPSVIRDVAMPWVHDGFFSVDVQSLRKHLLQLPWVEDVEIFRLWPSTIRLVVSEKRAVARWGGVHLITDSGDVFTPGAQHFPSDLPILVGPSEEAKTVFEHFVKMQSLLSPYHLLIRELHLTPRWSWWMRLDNGIVLMLGRKAPLLRLQRFAETYPTVIGTHAKDALRVDLRYPNGVAVKWRENAMTQVESSTKNA